MKTRPWLAGFLWVLVLALGGMTYLQHRTLRSMQIETEALKKSALLSGNAGASDDGSWTVVISDPAPTPAARVELMRLRSQVTELRERLRERDKVSNELRKLEAQVDAAGRYANGRFPAGFRRRQDARAVGAATPEAALETFLWAMEHRDTNAFLESIDPRLRNQFAEQLATGGGDQFFAEGRVLPGFLIVGRTNVEPDMVELRVEAGVGGSLPLKLRRVDGAWRLVF